MLMADGCSDFWDTSEIALEEDDNNENLCINYDDLVNLLDETPNHDRKSVGSSSIDASTGELVSDGGKHHDFQHPIEVSKGHYMENPNSFIGTHDLPTSLNNFGAEGTPMAMPFLDMLCQPLIPSESFLSQGFHRTSACDIPSFADSQDHHQFASSTYSFFPVNGVERTDIKEVGRFENDIAYSTSNSRNVLWGRKDELTLDNLGLMGYGNNCEDNNHIPAGSGNYSYPVDMKPLAQPEMCTPSNMTYTNKIKSEEDEKHNLGFPRFVFPDYKGAMDEDINKYARNADEKALSAKDLEGCPSLVSISSSALKLGFQENDVAEQAFLSDDIADGFACQSSNSEKHHDGMTNEFSGASVLNNCIAGHLPNFSQESIQSNSVDCRSNVDDDSDICIIEEMSHPAPSNQSDVLGRPSASEQLSSMSDTHHVSGVGGTRLKSEAERLIYRVALRDLSQPKSEDIPPDGALAVSLLRHQRIALSWMVKKETGINCSGGILADDQGLGKTVSTIALILKERSPIKHCQEAVKPGEQQTLNLDEDDEDKVSKKPRTDSIFSETIVKAGAPVVQRKGRPAAGTLIVCPTSVLRQWAEELRSKVAPEASLSVLLYHGGNRTRDPFELAKHDVVLTTYSIVSMEVPKQPLVDKDNDGLGKLDDRDLPPSGLSISKKRKHASCSDKKIPKNQKELEGALLESAAGPIAKVAWFRVVLDEAQSIKNHRTQVARACWGLRAKRRWCLSGTPIQNAIDDLYSYFRFLRYYPYDVYNTFCSDIKAPIQRSPGKGYKRLQAILKTVMLRRTKGTTLDGEPIIKLPPKFVELRKVEFSKEERDFYTRLEADSRAQFEEYAAAGTVKENYVNILLMLLRLRQACDHPLLVNGYNSSSLWKSSVEMAKKLPRQKLEYLLSCLEASLAICSICNDPPEEAVVSMCGHVFCNQCMCDHLTGEDSHCPATGCKAGINTSKVFSRSSLTSCLCEHPGLDGYLENSDTESLAPVNHPYSSSKIKAALEVLQSLSKPQDCTSRNGPLDNSSEGSANCTENSSAPSASPQCISPERNLVLHKPLNDSTKLVGEKAIVFSQWTRMLDLLEACLKCSTINYRRLDGTMSVAARDKAVKDFNTLPEVSVMIMSLKAASLGLNMVSACHVLLLDLWWNPTTEDQAVDRAHRIGQTRPVTVLRLTVKDTVEDRILALQQKKRVMVASAFGEDEKGGRQTRLTVEDLKYLFRL